MLDATLYPTTLVEELFAASYYLIRNFELAPYANDNLDEILEKRINNGKL